MPADHGRWLRRLRTFVVTRPAATVVIVAALARIAAIVAVGMVSEGTLFLDDRNYVELAEAAATGHQPPDQWEGYAHWLYWSVSAFLVPVTLLFEWFGPRPALAQAVSAVFGVATVACVAVIAVRVGGPRPAVAAGLAAGLIPSQILWSSLALKDAGVWAATAITALAMTVAWRETRLVRLAVLAAWIGSGLWLLGHLRLASVVVACIALLLAAACSPRPGVVRRFFAVAIAVTVVPTALGIGPAGWELAWGGAGSLGALRAGNAVGADSAFLDPDDQQDGLLASLRHLPRGLSAVVLEPFVWQRGLEPAQRAAAVENVAWYGMLALAALGTLEALRRRDPLIFPALLAGGVALMYGLTEGNIGTAIRHRGELVWPVALLAAHGAHARGWLGREPAELLPSAQDEEVDDT